MIAVPKKAAMIIETLEAAGHEAYIVGGCVRDALLSRTPEDWDITTSASPEEVKSLFRRTVDTGIAHGTVTVLLQGEGFEVTTFRVDGDYADGRHPDSVQFTKSLAEDLKRRDFTINAMAWHPQKGLTDLFHGRQDLENGIVRCVGLAEERFSEDALRILRAIRFCAQLGFTMEEKTRAAIKTLNHTLSKVSQERIQVEIVKLICGGYPERMRDAYELGITKVIMPEFDVIMEQPQNNRYHQISVGEHTIRVMQNIRPDKTMRLAALFHDFGKPAVCTQKSDDHLYFPNHSVGSERLSIAILRRLRMDKDTIDKVSKLVAFHDCPMKRDKVMIRHVMHDIGTELFLPLMELMRADTLGKTEYLRQERLDDIEAITEIYKEIIRDGDCITLKELAVTGADLIQSGMKPGKELGERLNQMLNHVLDHPEDNQKEILMNR